MITGCQRALIRPHQRPRRRPRTDGQGGHSAPAVLLAGRYRLLERVGRGATATVWRAHDERLDRDVAVKQFATARPSGTAGTAGGVHGRVDGLAEARIAARVRHPDVAAVHDVVEQDRSCWLVMDYVAADTLATVLRERRRLPPAIVAAVGLQLLAALRAVHEAGIVHCDVKPANLLLGDDARLVLVDFGIAEVAGDTPVARDGGEIVGSPAYLAPELVRGETPGAAADLWSMGATLYAAVEGRPPFPHDDPAPMLEAVLLSPPRPARRAGPLRPLLDRLLVKDAAARPSHNAIHALLSAAQQRPDRVGSPGSGHARQHQPLPPGVPVAPPPAQQADQRHPELLRHATDRADDAEIDATTRMSAARPVGWWAGTGCTRSVHSAFDMR